MFITPEQAQKITNVELSADLLFRAQNIIESYIGKTEPEIKNGKDKIFMARATAYQAAYMKENESVVYEQIAVDATGSGTSFQNFDKDKNAPWIAPLAHIVLKYISFNKSRSYKTGRIFQFQPRITTWRNT